MAIALIAIGSSALAPPLLATPLASTRKQPTKQPAHSQRKQVNSLTPGEAAREAQHANGGGRVLSVMREEDGYQVKLIKDGEVRIVFIPID